MALVRFIFQSSILASTMLSGFLIHINPARAEVTCIVTDDDKPMCGKMISIPRMCVASDDGKPICGKFTKVKKENESSKRQTSEPFKNPRDGSPAYTKKIDSFSFSLSGCSKQYLFGSVIMCIFEIDNRGGKQSQNFTLKTSASNFVDFEGKSYAGQGSILHRESAPIALKLDSKDTSISVDNKSSYTGMIVFRLPENIDLNRVPLLNVATNLGTFQFWNLSELK